MNIVFVYADFSGCGWYRCIMPAEVINNRKLANAIATNLITDEVMEWGDIFVWQRQHHDKVADIVSKYRHKIHIAEFDDNLLQIPTTNPAYKNVNDEVKKNFIKMVKLCDAVTVSTQPLKEVFSRYHQNIFVLPNSIPINYMNVPDIQKLNEDKGEVRIGWCGSAYHHDDLKYILHPLYEVALKYPHVKLVFMGWLPDYLKSHLPPDRLEYHNWVEFKDYYDKLKDLNLDIALAPLDYNEFNKSKSNLKYLDYTTVGVPVIASDVYPYATTIENGFDGIVVKKNRHTEWVKAISELVENKVRRLELTLNAQEKLVRDYDIYKNIHLWMDVYKGLLSKKETAGIAPSELFPESALAHKYCVGKGLEIGGSAHNPFGLDTLSVDYTDSMDTPFKRDEVKHCGRALKVDIVAPGDSIPLPDESQDFIVSSHVLEHFTNPIKALIEWDRLIRPGGVIFMIIPHKERTFDKDKERTPLTHLIKDFINNTSEPHGDPNGHEHYWITEDIVELVIWMIGSLKMKWRLLEVSNVDDKVGNGFTIVIRKLDRSSIPPDVISRLSERL